MMQKLLSLLTVSLASAAWFDSPRYGQGYLGGFLTSDTGARPTRCVPCDTGRSQASNSLDYRGNGADNLGYDWSPSAWGGPAFPNKDKSGSPSDDWGSRGGRMMPGAWNEKCRDCGGARQNQGWGSDRYTERPGDVNRPGDRPRTWPGDDPVSTVTSSVLGVRIRDDKRLPVEWPGGGRSMRWDGFRNGMPWDRAEGPDHMDRRHDTGRGVSSWDRDGNGHYASDWSYGSRDPAGSSTKWNDERPWSQSWNQKNQPNGYGSSGDNAGLPFGSSYPDRFPSTNTWRPPTSSSNRPSYNYPTSNRPQYSPDDATNRPRYPTSRPSYGSNSNNPPQGNLPWNNYEPQNPDRYDKRPGSWTTPQPNQNYLPQSTRPPSRPGYDFSNERPNRPYGGTPGTAIWNGQPDYNNRPGGSSTKRPGYYTGFITEIHDPNYGGRPGDYKPQDRYPTGSQFRPEGNYIKDKYPSSFPGRPKPDYNQDRYPTNYPSRPDVGYNKDKYPNNLTPGEYYDRFPAEGNRYPQNRPQQRPGNNYNNYPDNANRPDYGDTRYPSSGERYPVQRPTGGDRPYEGNSWNSNRYPGSHDSGGKHNSGNKYPNYGSEEDQNRYPGYGDRDSNRNPGYNGDDRYGDRRPSYGGNRDRYPSRPGGSDHDHGPSPGSDSGSWNYGDNDQKDGTYRRSGGSYPPYKGGQYFTSSYLASASTPAASSHEVENKKGDETTLAPNSDN